MKPTIRQLADGRYVFADEVQLGAIEPWNPTMGQIRDVILKRHILGDDLTTALPVDPVAKQFVPSQREVESVNSAAHDAVTYGRMIDFGSLPNQVIMSGGARGGALFNIGAVGQPFGEPWILVHTWDSEKFGELLATAVYLVRPYESGDCEVCELQPARLGGPDVALMIGDRAFFQKQREGQPEPHKYHALPAPYALRFITDQVARAQINDGGTPGSAAAANVGDPLMTALLILNTRGVERETIAASEKLQKARRKSGKLPIPSYQRVNAAPYVTAIQMRGKARARGEDQGGTHASPVPHLRIGHPRTYADGHVTFIRDTLVNVEASQRAEFLRTRSHYTVKA